jgi:hypothetical protein
MSPDPNIGSAMGILKRLSSAIQEGRLLSGVVRRYWAFESFVREHYHRMILKQFYQKSHELPCIAARGSFSADPAGILVNQSLARALANIGGPPDFVRAIDGMSGQKYRTFINNLVGSYPDARYLEIGSWGGSTATAALYGNSVKALCIDNWSQFGGPRTTFFANIERVLCPQM